MKIILLGAHGTGKTTFANILKDKYGWPIIESPSRIIHNIPGLTPEQYQEIITRMNQKTWDDLSHYKKCTIFCRTVIDNLSYDSGMEAFDKGIINSLDPYLEYQWIKKHFSECGDVIIVIRIPVEFPMEKDGVRPESEEYQKLIDQRQEAILRSLIKDGVIKEKNVCRITGGNYTRLAIFEDFIQNMLISNLSAES